MTSLIKLQLSLEKTAALEKKIFEQPAEKLEVVIDDDGELTLKVFKLL